MHFSVAGLQRSTDTKILDCIHLDWFYACRGTIISQQLDGLG